jgi:hypothetical protein
MLYLMFADVRRSAVGRDRNCERFCRLPWNDRIPKRVLSSFGASLGGAVSLLQAALDAGPFAGGNQNRLKIVSFDATSGNTANVYIKGKSNFGLAGTFLAVEDC